ncbi:MAG: hypothetical protein IPM42_12660 [Saprospiraceae bacterium]|nr:hypothetical protein [Saprospiraceae bacterium]
MDSGSEEYQVILLAGSAKGTRLEAQKERGWKRKRNVAGKQILPYLTPGPKSGVLGILVNI